MLSAMKGWWVLAMVVMMFSVLISWSNPRDESQEPLDNLVSFASTDGDHGGRDFFMEMTHYVSPNLIYDFYRDTCPEAEVIVKSMMARIYSQQKDVSAHLLRLFFHDCIIQGCDASVLLDDSNGNKNHSIEKQAVPNKTLKGFEKIDNIKEVIESVCPGVVSCADILSLATRDGIVLAGGPFYPVFTGRRDSAQSYYAEAMAEIPKPDVNITEALGLFSLRGAHNIGTIGCEFIQARLNNFKGTGQPDPTVAPGFIREMRLSCQDSDNKRSLGIPELEMGMSFYQQLSSSIPAGAGFDTHYYQSLLRGRGLLFADQQLMANERTAKLVRAYASDDGSTFRMDFARAMIKLSGLNVLTGSQGQVRVHCSLPAYTS